MKSDESASFLEYSPDDLRVMGYLFKCGFHGHHLDMTSNVLKLSYKEGVRLMWC